MRHLMLCMPSHIFKSKARFLASARTRGHLCKWSGRCAFVHFQIDLDETPLGPAPNLRCFTFFPRCFGAAVLFLLLIGIAVFLIHLFFFGLLLSFVFFFYQFLLLHVSSSCAALSLFELNLVNAKYCNAMNIKL